MKNKTLSPAAQSVVDAFLKIPLQPAPEWDYARDIAVLLRAVADEIETVYWESDRADTLRDGVLFAMHHIVTIATELEGGPYAPY